MSEQSEPRPITGPEQHHHKATLDVVKQQALAVLDARRQADLDELFFADPKFASENPDQAALLKTKFLTEKKKLVAGIRAESREPNMGDMLALAYDYFGLISVVKLSETNHDTAGESKRLHDEFGDLMQWLDGHGVAVPRLSRPESDRWFDVETFGQESDGLDGYRAIIHRFRPLVNAELTIFGDEGSQMPPAPARLIITKETVFSMPMQRFCEVMSGRGIGPEKVVDDEGKYVWSEEQKQRLENYMYSQSPADTNWPPHRINTAYFAALLPEHLLLSDEATEV